MEETDWETLPKGRRKIAGGGNTFGKSKTISRGPENFSRAQ